MKITKTQLRQIINEEVRRVIKESNEYGAEIMANDIAELVFDNNDQLVEEWYLFKAGTPRDEILDWFEQVFRVSYEDAI